MQVHNTDCCCKSCLGSGGKCEYEDYRDEWRSVMVRGKGKKRFVNHWNFDADKVNPKKRSLVKPLQKVLWKLLWKQLWNPSVGTEVCRKRKAKSSRWEPLSKGVKKARVVLERIDEDDFENTKRYFTRCTNRDIDFTKYQDDSSSDWEEADQMPLNCLRQESSSDWEEADQMPLNCLRQQKPLLSSDWEKADDMPLNCLRQDISTPEENDEIVIIDSIWGEDYSELETIEVTEQIVPHNRNIWIERLNNLQSCATYSNLEQMALDLS